MPGGRRAIRALSWVLAAWGFIYAAYRAYYGFGGTAGMIGTVSATETFRAINLAAAAILLLAAMAPVAILPLWRRPRIRAVLLAVCWLAAVACVGHALIDDAQRVASLAGVFHISYPAEVWAHVDERTADLQDLVWNETWFLLEGLLWAALGYAAMRPGRLRMLWLVSACAATAVATAIGLLSAFGVIGRAVVL